MYREGEIVELTILNLLKLPALELTLETMPVGMSRMRLLTPVSRSQYQWAVSRTY
jgi:hypothetical protein